ncbi:hypothetical protein EC988_006698, partial [Linderina pennispora]
PAKAGVEHPAISSTKPAPPAPPAPKPAPTTADQDDDVVRDFGGLKPAKGGRGVGPNGSGGVVLVNDSAAVRQAVIGVLGAVVGLATFALAI